MKLSDYIAYKLEQMKIDKVFGYTGGSIADIIDSICRTKKVYNIYNLITNRLLHSLQMHMHRLREKPV